MLRPADLGAPVRKAWELLTTVPETTAGKALRGVLLLVGGIIVIGAEHEAVVDLAFILIDLYIAHAGAAELMRLSIDATPAPASERARTWGRTIVIVGIAVLALVGAGLLVSLGAASDDEPEVVAGECNGDDAQRPGAERGRAPGHAQRDAGGRTWDGSSPSRTRRFRISSPMESVAC